MKTVLITGAAGGIGSAAATAFEQAGCQVIRHDLREEAGLDVTGDLLDAVVAADLAEVARAEAVDVVVAAHGLAGSGELRSISDERIATIMDVNTVSVLKLYAAVSQNLIDRDGCFVVVSSQAGLDGEAQNGIYSASKFALVGWARGVAAIETAPRMRVVCPGMTETPLLVNGLRGMAEDAGVSYDELLACRLQGLPSGRLGRPSEIGRSILWLAQLSTHRAVTVAITGGETFE